MTYVLIFKPFKSKTKKIIMKKPLIKKLILAGAGHAHIDLLRQLAKDYLQGVDITLISAQPETIYSGMLPGWMAGHYNLDEISIDIVELCRRASVSLIQCPIVAIDADMQIVTTTNNYSYGYDLLSLNTGADTDLSWLNSESIDIENDSIPKANDDVIAIRPLHEFTQQWQQIVEDAKQSTHYRLAIVGAGAAATELVMAAQFALQQINPAHKVYLVCGEHLLSGFDSRFRAKVIKQLDRHNIEIIYARATNYSEGNLFTTDATSAELLVDKVIAATGVTGSSWTKHTDLSTVDNGFIAVNEWQQSSSHSNVFAVGDVSTRVDKQVAHSGVHAVFGGKIAADNLFAYLEDRSLQSYHPKNRNLYLLSCGDKYAIGSWGRFSLQGYWVWQLKRYIDKRFVHSK